MKKCSITNKHQNTAPLMDNWIIAVIADVTVSIDNCKITGDLVVPDVR